MKAASSKTLVQDIICLVSENDTLRLENEMLRKSSINAEKFYNSPFTVEMVAALHSVSKTTVLNYIKRGMIETHPLSTEGKVLIRGSVALTLDFKELKHDLKFQ